MTADFKHPTTEEAKARYGVLAGAVPQAASVDAKCPTCGGLGMVTTNRMMLGAFEGEYEEIDCPTCSTPTPGAMQDGTAAGVLETGGEWIPNTDYSREATWPPPHHPLSSLFHNARLQWPHNMDSRFQYERLVAWLQGTDRSAKETIKRLTRERDTLVEALRAYVERDEEILTKNPQVTPPKRYRDMLKAGRAALAQPLPSDAGGAK